MAAPFLEGVADFRAPCAKTFMPRRVGKRRAGCVDQLCVWRKEMPGKVLGIPDAPEPLSDDLHVLLRHRLLPQRGGFEGLGLAQEDAPPDGLRVAHLDDVPGRLFHGRLAPETLAAKAHPREYHVSQVSYLVDLRAEVREDIVEVLPPSPKTVVASVRITALHLQDARNDLHIEVLEP